MRIALLGGALLVILIFLGLGGWALAHRSLATSGGLLSGGRGAAQVFGTGQLIMVEPPYKARSFHLQLFSGQTFDLYNERGKPVLINFWASWCIPCQTEVPALQKVWQAFHARVVFLGIDVWDTRANAVTFLKDHNVAYPVAEDPSGHIAIDYGITGVPETFLLNKEGQVVDHWIGPVDEKELTRLLEQLIGS
ncbi:MAG: TlpA family protein disulfide reductase [Chloroflexi bacterium]|nr:TlpA family protein disulfide reductase [Chloroflexota bacterium]